MKLKEIKEYQIIFWRHLKNLNKKIMIIKINLDFKNMKKKINKYNKINFLIKFLFYILKGHVKV